MPGLPKEDAINVSYQVDVVGVGMLLSWFGIWLEGGYGDQGNAKAGISFNFRK